MNLTINQATEQIKELHNGIMQASRRSVQDAIKIGEIISEQRKLLNPEDFTPWLKSLPFDDNTGYRYLKLYVYKIPNVGDLSTAYKKVSEIEYQEKQSEQERKRELISKYRKTGVKPYGWDRSLDYEYEKQKRLEKERLERIEKEQSDREKRSEERKIEKESSDMAMDMISEAVKQYLEESIRKEEWKEKIKLSDSGKDDAFQSAIIDYLETLENDNRRIEACQNIIKICRNISVELQKIKENNNDN